MKDVISLQTFVDKLVGEIDVKMEEERVNFWNQMDDFRERINDVGDITEQIHHLKQNILTALAQGRVAFALWSGGLDSTVSISNYMVLHPDHIIVPFVLNWTGNKAQAYSDRELYSREALLKFLWKFGLCRPIELEFGEDVFNVEGQPLPINANRNKIFVQKVGRIMKKFGVNELICGEYVGAEHWVVNWDVPEEDCTPDSWLQWLIDVGVENPVLYHLGLYGPSYTKKDRVELGVKALKQLKLPVWILSLTTSCLSNSIHECGRCYGCVEVAAAWTYLYRERKITKQDYEMVMNRFVLNPKESFLFTKYMKQFDKVDAVHK